MSRFEAPASSITGMSNILGDHFYPIVSLFTPLYWIAPAPEMLLGAQAALFAISIVPVYLFLRNRLAGGYALALSIGYGLFWGLQRAAAFDVHEMAFAPLIIATAIYAMDRGRWTLFFTCAVLLTVVKEDLIPILTFMARRNSCVLSQRLAARIGKSWRFWWSAGDKMSLVLSLLSLGWWVVGSGQ